MSEERNYVIGTHDAEIERLGVQHRVWRASVLDFWRDGGITEGMTVIDAGAGAGHAAFDLAEIVGPKGRVIAIERSRRFLDALRDRARARRLSQIEIVDCDLAELDWSQFAADAVWCRWVLAFVPAPEPIVQGMARALKPGGAALLHEYYDYASWRLAPHSAPFESYVAKIIARWRASGGEPDVALALPAMLARAGLRVDLARPQVFAARMDDFASRWPMGFAREYLGSMHDADQISGAEASLLSRLFDEIEADSEAIVISPGVLQIRARKPEQIGVSGVSIA